MTALKQKVLKNLFFMMAGFLLMACVILMHNVNLLYHTYRFSQEKAAWISAYSPAFSTQGFSSRHASLASSLERLGFRVLEKQAPDFIKISVKNIAFDKLLTKLWTLQTSTYPAFVIVSFDVEKTEEAGNVNGVILLKPY